MFMKPKNYRYEDVISQVINLIIESDLKIGDRLPAEKELAERFDCNYLTIRKAMALMAGQRLLERRRGSGTYLQAPVERLRVCRSSKVSFLPANQLAMIINPHLNDFIVETLGRMTVLCARRGIGLVVHPLKEFNDETLTLPALLEEQGCQAVMISVQGWNTPELRMLREFVSRCRIPVVVNSRYPGLEEYSYEPLSRMGISSRREMRFACRYLLELGYEHIIYFSEPLPETHLSYVKQEEYRQEMSRSGREAQLELVPWDFTGIDGVIERMSSKRGKAAVICFDDGYALRLMTALYRRGFSVPEDFALLGCNDQPAGGCAEPPLSTFRFPYDYVVESFVGEALKRAGIAPAEAVRLPDLAPVIRESCQGRRLLGNRLEETVNRIRTEVYYELS